MKSNIRIKNRSIFNMPDNREVVITAGEMKRCFDEELKVRVDEMYKDVQNDIAAQLMAALLTELHLEFGFGSERLGRVKRGTEGLFRGMLSGGIMGKEFNTINCIEYMKEKFGVDVRKEES